jgi:allantoin racemase
VRIGVLGSGVRWAGGQPPAYLVEAAGSAALVGVGLRGGLFPYTPADGVLVDAAHLEAGYRLLAHRPDALFIDTIGEYALDALRSATGLPVVGAAEAAFATAATVGPRFAIVTVWPESMAWIYRARLRRHAAEPRCAGIAYVGTGTAIAQLRADVATGADALTSAVVHACRTAAGAGAESIVLGCTCMAPMHAALADAVRVPVLCASRLGLQAAIEAARAGLPPAIADYPRAEPALAARVSAAVAALSAAPAAAAGPDSAAGVEAGTGCPVCIGPSADE